MALGVRLLGPPAIVRDGQPVRLGGRKTWGLLTFLVLEPRAPTRRDVIDRLVPEANDPLAALRWLLHQVRRALQPDARIEERDGRLRLSLEHADVDVLRLLDVPRDVEEVERLVGGELLEGMAFDDVPTFDLWLALERTRVRNAGIESLWWASTQVASEEPERALRLVERGLLLDPYCETKNELVVDLYVQMGNGAAALAHVDAVDRRYRDDLGMPMPETIRRPLERPRPLVSVPAAPSARALLRSAGARLEAGEYDRAVVTARRAADAALASGDRRLELDALALLASVLIHTHRGRDLEAKGLLSRGAQLANDLGDVGALADVEREMGFVLCMEANYGAAEGALARSAALAREVGDEERAGKAETYLGTCRSDRCDFGAAEEALTTAIGRFEAVGNLGWVGYAEGMLARVFERSGDPERGRTVAESGTEHVRTAGWTAILPWPMLVWADCALVAGDRAEARDAFAEALTLGTEIGDPCWESLSLRGLGLLEAEAGDTSAAVELLADGLTRCTRFDDVYAWARAVILADLVELERGRDPAHVEAGLEVALAGPMPDLAERLRPWRPGAVQTPPQTRVP